MKAAMTKATLTQPHAAWFERYERQTGFDPMWLEELDGTDRTFADVAQRNLRWYEDHANDVMRQIEGDIPWCFDENGMEEKE